MTSYIIYSEDQTLFAEKLNELCHIYSIDQFDQTTVSPEKETSIGIEIVQKLQKKAMLKPLRGKNKAIILTQAELLTVPAQNALLKLLEEPPLHTYFFLLTDNLDSFLPTIISRCQVIKIESSQLMSVEEAKKIEDQLNTWQRQSIGDALKTAEKLAKDKNDALQVLKKTMGIGSKQLREGSKTNTSVEVLSDQLKMIQQTYRTLYSTNTNPRLALEHLFLLLRQ